jgi:hypothetical protein
MKDDRLITFSAVVKLPYPATIFGITVDGIQPLPFIRDRLHVLDRSVISRLCAPAQAESDQYWISQLDSPDITINPIFAATEGKDRRTPSRDEFVQEYFRTEAVVRRSLPSASLIPHTEKTVADSYALVEDICERRIRETAFLLAAVPLVVQRVSTSELISREREVLSLAQSHGLTGGSLSLLAVLSCLYESDTHTSAAPGRGVLKPKAAYTADMAHHCLSDILALELMVALSSFQLGNGAFISADQKLGRFWQALGATSTEPRNGKATGTFRINAELLHRIDDNGLERLERLFTP